MANAVVNFLVEKLLQLLSENIELIRGADNDFKDLLEEVQWLKAFLDDAAKFHSESESSQWDQLVKRIHKTVHQAEDDIDDFLVQSKLHREKGKIKRAFSELSHSKKVKDLAAEIKGIHENLKVLRKDNQQVFQADPALKLPKKSAPEQGPSLEDAEVVGFDEEANKVIRRLVEGSAECVDIVPVMGMPGLGKTTLARKIVNDSRLSYEFFSIIWVYVGQTYTIKDIFLKILKVFTKRMGEHQGEDVDKLAKVISGFMNKGGRCLIVLDDVWVAEVIDHVKNVFPKNKKGHRIMMTTRDRYLATYANPDPHDLKFLTPPESFELLVKRVFGKLGSCPAELKELGEKIAVSCDGVPLAVVVIAGALRGRPNKSDWVRVERNVAQHLFNKDSPESCLKFVKMSYDRLPQEMQTCFLYCGVFPRGFDIPSWKLIRMWIAEGLIKPQQVNTLEETAESCLNDLVNRNLVILLQKKSDGQIKTCRLHDMLHQFCREAAIKNWLFEEIFLTADHAIPDNIPDTCRRLCIQSPILSDFLSTKRSAKHVRSFYCFSKQQKQIELSPNAINLIHTTFPLIRVLDVEPIKLSLSQNFSMLYHLRYVAISGNFKFLPTSFGEFWNLQTLVLNTSTSESTLDVKADIWKLLQFRHIHTNIPAKLPPPNSTTASKTSCLQTLSMVAPESCKRDVLAKACYLKKLSIRGRMEAFLESKGGISNLEELKCLEHLKLLNDVLSIKKTVHLPAAFFRLVRTVKKLTLANTRFSWSDADRLAQMESLEVLKLKENAFVGKSWKQETGGFSALQVLWIERSELECWEASSQNFPILRHLILICCDKLKAVPLGFADVHNFQEMRLDNTSKDAVKSAKEIKSKKSESIKFKLTIFPPETDTE